MSPARLTLLATALLIAAPAPAATPARLHQYDDLALAPAGDRVAAVESDVLPDATSAPHGHIVIRSAKTGAILRSLDPCAACKYDGLAFGPDGRLAFLARQGSVTRLMVAGAAGAPATLTRIDGIAQMPRWSPDGGRIAVLATLGARKEAGATQAGVRQVGEIGETSDEQRIAVVPASGGALKPISPADRYVYEYDWTPDGAGFVLTSAPGNGDNNWWVATLDRLDARTGALTRLAAPPVQMNYPRVSPDGRTVAFIGGLMSDFGAVGGDIYTVPPTAAVSPPSRRTSTMPRRSSPDRPPRFARSPTLTTRSRRWSMRKASAGSAPVPRSRAGC
ncbi:MAG: hypothetical protein LC656_11730 [Sphingomonadales bacterium]|nr:hypothetical protein [Sphingomonadales bacterium]